MLGVHTPRWSKMVSWKYAHLPAAQVVEDLLVNHGRITCATTIQSVSYQVGDLLLANESELHYSHGVEPCLVRSMSVGRDGAMLKLNNGLFPEAMVGTISLIGADRQVLHTIYLGDGPEYGKAGFDTLLTNEIETLKGQFGSIPWVGLADGAVHNWHFLAPHVDQQILDFWHAWHYIQQGLALVYTDEKQVKKAARYWKDRLLEEENSIQDLIGFFHKQARKIAKAPTDSQSPLTEPAKFLTEPAKSLKPILTYLDNHAHQMNYAAYLAKGFLIGSGVTESACKTLIKNRFCGAGMQWKEENTQVMTLMRGLVLTPKRWEQAWKQITKSAA